MEKKKSRKRKTALWVLVTIIIGILGFQSVFNYKLMGEVNQLESEVALRQEKLEGIEAVEEVEVEEVELEYTLEDLKTLRTEPLTNESRVFESRKLTPDEWSTDITIEKWEGEDYVIAVPNSNERAEEGLSNRINVITLLSGGEIVAQYSTGYWDACDIQLLPDKMLLWVRNVGPNNNSEAGVAEIDYDGNFLWGMVIEELSHSIELLPNGNYLSVRANYDQVIEFTKEGELIWEWNCLEGIPPYVPIPDQKWHADVNIFSEFRMATGRRFIWTHINSIQKLDDGYLFGLRNLNMAVKVGFDKEIRWTFGALLWNYQHRPWLLENGNILVYDNGNYEVAEYRIDGSKAWSYPIDSRRWGRIYKLDNGNYLFPNSFQGEILEVDADGEIIKHVVMGKMCVVHYASIELLEEIK